MFHDLREFIAEVEKLGECRIVAGADWNLEIGALSHLMSLEPKTPLLLFDRIKGYQSGFRVATNLFATPGRTALALGLPLEAEGLELVRALRDRMRGGVKLFPPEERG